MKKICEKLEKLSFIVVLYGFGVLLPLYVDHYYFNIMEAKADIYNQFLKYSSILLIITLIIKIINKKLYLSKPKLMVYLMIFFTFVLISTIGTFAPGYVLFGQQGWYIGFITIGSLILIILITKDIKLDNKYIYYPVYIAIIIIFIIAILHSFHIDVFNLHYTIPDDQYHNYLSTIGNIDWFVGYLCLIVPLFTCLYIKENRRIEKIIYLIISSLGVLTIALLNADGIYLGIGFASFFIIPFVFNNPTNIKKFSYILFIFLIGIILARILDYQTGQLNKYLLSNISIISISIITLVLFICGKKADEAKYNVYKNKIILILEILLVFIALAAIILIALNFNDEFGNNRGILWKYSFELFNKFRFKEKLIGLGPETLINAYSYISANFGSMYLSSHSEPIQLLLTTGIFGLISWLLCWGCILVSFFKAKTYKTSLKIEYYVPLFCYFGQSLVNSATTVNVATLAIVIILYLQNNNI